MPSSHPTAPSSAAPSSVAEPPTPPPFVALVDRLRERCAAAGFDLVQPLAVGWYNGVVQGALRLDDWGSPGHLAVVVGNSRALWPVFLDALARDAQLAAARDPLDTYCERELSHATAQLGVRASVRFAHEGGERRVAMQRLAHAAGLAYLTETHASVHPVYGPWVGLRAAISIAIVGPSGPPPVVPHPCQGCAGRCLPAFEHALSTVDVTPSEANMQAHWQAWLAWRDACPIGREHRYSDAQIRYHYLHDPVQLRAAIAKGSGP